MKMSIEEYGNYLQQLHEQVPENKEVVAKKKVTATNKSTKKALKRKNYREIR